MRTVHRVISLFVVLVTLYLGITGTLIQATDLRTLFRHAAATDPEMMAIREDHDGPGDYAVIGPADFTATVLPAQFDYRAALPKLLGAARAALGEAPLSYAEIRMSDGKPIGRVQSGRQWLRYDFVAGQGQISWQAHQVAKQIHRGSYLGLSGRWMDLAAGVTLIYLSVSGLVMYFDMWQRRRRSGRKALIWI